MNPENHSDRPHGRGAGAIFVGREALSSQPLSRKRAMVWCAFLGAFGAHRFYLGENGLGSLYLCFSWTLIPLVASLLDFALLAMQDDEDFAEERREIPLLRPPVYERPAVRVHLPIGKSSSAKSRF